tara:strand:- start:223 stop:408 length:186 start_codon:yes stop_codon:yes gene_type:complete
LEIELTLENLKTIKLWHYFLFKDNKDNRESTREDNQTITKINALVITAREERDHDRIRRRK